MIFLAVLSLFIFSVLFFFNGERDYKKDLTITRTGSYIEGLRIVNKRNGIDSWIITAGRADFTKDETTARMDSVTVDIIKEKVTVNADNGVYNMNTRDLSLMDNIKIWIKDSVISTERLSWNPTAKILTSDNKILMEGKKFKIEGKGLTATEGQKVKLMKDVKAIFF
ncbi:MAG: hypothetical protein OHK0032_00670 [Thermodesulfovibrionales bacterium]